MKTVLAAALLLCSVAAVAQTKHDSVLNWTKSGDDTGSATYTVYRTNQLCGALPLQFSPLVSNLPSTNTYTDSTVTVGYYCYEVTATVNGAESLDSNTAEARVLPLAPTALTATAK